MSYFGRCTKKNKIPNIPIFIDSPMGNNVYLFLNNFLIGISYNNEYHGIMGVLGPPPQPFPNIINILMRHLEDHWWPRPKTLKLLFAGWIGYAVGLSTYLKQFDRCIFNIGLFGWFFRQKDPWPALLDRCHELKFFANTIPSRQKSIIWKVYRPTLPIKALIALLKDIENISWNWLIP